MTVSGRTTTLYDFLLTTDFLASLDYELLTTQTVGCLDLLGRRESMDW